MTWKEEYHRLVNAGFEEAEILQEAARQREEFSNAGFGEEEIKEYFGQIEPDMSPVKQMIEENIAQSEETPDKPHDFFDKLSNAFFSGLDNSSGHMAIQALRGKPVTPDDLLPEDAGTFLRTVSQAATIAGDLPAMVVGGILGGAAGGITGSAAPVVGNLTLGALGAGAGANAAPEAIRAALMEYYEKGEIRDFGDFWERTSATFLDTVKAGAIGAATMGVGAKVAGTLAAKGVSTELSRISAIGSEVATMVSLGKTLEGEMPTAQDFLDGALLVGALHGMNTTVSAAGTKTSSKLRELFAKTGVKPHEIVDEANANPIFRQQLLVDGDTVPGMSGEVSIRKKSPPLPDPEVTAKSAAEEKILSKIGKNASAETAATPIGETFRSGWDSFYTNFVDKFDPIKRTVEDLTGAEKRLSADKDPYQLARLANDGKAKAKYMFEKGVLDYRTLAPTGKGLFDILEPIKSDIESFKAYLVSKRALELEARGIKSGFDVEAAKEVAHIGLEKFESVAKELVEFQNGVLKYYRDSGFIDQKGYDSMVEANKNYVSFKRISEEGSALSSAGKKIRAIKGSELNIQDPLNSILENTIHHVKNAEVNRARSSLIDLASATPDQTILEKVERPSTTLAENEFDVFREGERMVFKTTPELASALKTLDGNAPAQNLALKIAMGVARTITRVKRFGISITPDFITKNLIRDQVTTGVYTKGGAIPFWDTAIAMGDIIKKNDAYYNWLKSGGASGSFLELNEAYLQSDFFKVEKHTGAISMTWNVLQKPIEWLQAAGSLAEQATRLAEAKRVLGTNTSGTKVFEAGMASREATIDFQRIGAKVSAWNAITAFMNAGIQGLDKTAREFKHNPKAVAGRAAALITVPSILLWWANRDDERVKDLPRWQRDLHWIIATDDWQQESEPGEASRLPSHLVRMGTSGIPEINKGHLYRIPKPQELGIIFGSGVERILDRFFNDNPEALEDFGETLAGIVSPNIIPDVITPIAEQWANKSTFTGSKLVPSHLEGVLPQYQYTDYTTDTAKALGRIIQAVPFIGNSSSKEISIASPMVVENYVQAWSGSTGKYVLQLADRALEAAGLSEVDVEPESSLSDIPFIKAFVVRNPSGSTESIIKFQERYEKNRQYLASFKLLNKSGNLEEAERFRFDSSIEQNFQDLSGINEAIKNQGHFIRSIYRNKEMSASDKRQLIDGAYYQMSEIAKLGLKGIKEFEAVVQGIKN